MIIGSAYAQKAAKKEAVQKETVQKEAVQKEAAQPLNQGAHPQDPRRVKQQASTTTPSQPQLKYFVFTEECFNKLTQGQIDIDCIKFSISKLLSFGIIGGSLLYKAPQIIKILNAGSVEGLSLSSYYFQLMMVLITIGYNLHLHAPISTYAENISVMVQTAIIIVLYWKFSPKTTLGCVLGSIGLFSGIGAVMYMDILPDVVYQGIGIINIVLFMCAVLPQIKLIYQNKSTGQLSIITTLLAWAGNIARVFTTSQEVKDPLLLAFFIIGSILNGTVLLQFFIYRKNAPKTAPAKATKSE